MRKRILSLLLCAVMIVGLMPMSVSALEEEQYPYVAGTQITPENASNVLGDGKVSYDTEENVLTLKNATITADNEPYGIYAEGDLLIELVGENKITSSEVSDQNICAAIYSKNGNIRIFAGDNSDDAVLTAVASLQNSETDYSSYGIYGKDIFVEDGVKVIAESGDASLQSGFKSCGISGDAISITNATVNAVAGSGCYSYAIEGTKGITIENSDVTAQSNSEVVYWENYNVLHSGGIIAPTEGDIHISGGTVKAQSNEAEILSVDIGSMNGSLTIDNKAVVQANSQDSGFASDDDEGVGIGLMAYGDITINDAKVYAMGREATLSAGIYSHNNVIINGEVNAIGSRSNASYVSSGGSFGILAETGSVTINGGKVTTSIGMTESALCSGICAYGDVIINTGEIFASGSDAVPIDGVKADLSCGIMSQAGDVVFNGETAKVTANGGYASRSSVAVAAMAGNVKFFAGEVDLLGYIEYADNYDISCYGVVASRGEIQAMSAKNEKSSSKGNIVVSGGNVRSLGNTGAFYLDGDFIAEPSANLILTMKANEELVGALETWGLTWEEYLQAVKEFLLAQDVNAEEIDGSPFTAKAVISNEIANKWKSFSCSTQKIVPVTYTLSFESNGGSSIAPVTDEDGSVIELSQYTPKKDGFRFTGWYADKALTEKVTSIKLDSNKTVYAGWTEKEISVIPEDITIPPKTGDSNNIMLWVILLFISGGVIGAAAYRKKKQSN